mmetsp:Transcript_53/g.66  ORF Transcript_53/g.66 Transcript_53/m.66 type:complete len:179 (+) Transcript_53:133-669(+)|eukprot:CAMPEP_0178442164 /NCGR_PEP_ID=MMETSP0689_2-20121128/37982_1 /TAXON_ID=160604 /ORGANISM="Amphidinium massartii, Strain CS-259" /LENGTH=178 /DNA_ID=CAMNT_0020065619 /DNA_START=46 /DNA_END=582 /DNA_ORIENTATION=+
MEVTPDYVTQLSAPTEGFLCPLSANVYGIDFINFKIRAVDEGSERLLFEVCKEEGLPADDADDSARFIRYHFGPGFLDFRTIGTTLEFVVGDQPLHNFRMIERHYFRNQLIRSYDFELPFVIPGTKNTWEVIYTMPELTQEWKNAVISAPWETRSDSFYFVDGKLVMHNRAEYNYGPE